MSTTSTAPTAVCDYCGGTEYVPAITGGQRVPCPTCNTVQAPTVAACDSCGARDGEACVTPVPGGALVPRETPHTGRRTPEREEFLADIIICAVEGGTKADGLRLDVDAVARGIGRIVRGEIAVNASLTRTIRDASKANDACEIDADAADVITQAALLGSVVYG